MRPCEKERDKRTSAEWRIERELEPRIKAEEHAYDRWVSTDTGAEACECFSSLIDELIEFAKLCKQRGAKVVFSVVDTISKKDIEACKKIADNLKVDFRVREME